VRGFRFAAYLITLFFPFLSSVAQSIQLFVDLTDAPRNIYHSRLTIPVKPGSLTLVYPKWIPGNHRPSGPIANVTGIKMQALGQILAWERDPVDMYAFHVVVPAGASELQVSLDTITTDGSAGASGPSATSNVLDLARIPMRWKSAHLCLFPQGGSLERRCNGRIWVSPEATILPTFSSRSRSPRWLILRSSRAITTAESS
jgi:hypothetical protein